MNFKTPLRNNFRNRFHSYRECLVRNSNYHRKVHTALYWVNNIIFIKDVEHERYACLC